MRGVAESCYSGECGDCLIEIEAVVTRREGARPTCEVYPMPGGVADLDIDFPPNDYDLYFPRADADDNHQDQ